MNKKLQMVWLLEIDGECVGVFSSPEMAQAVAQTQTTEALAKGIE